MTAADSANLLATNDVEIVVSDDAVDARSPESLPLPYLERPVGGVLKRAIDIVVSGTSILVLSPVLVAVAAAIRVDSAGPVLFRQGRLGRNGRQFDMIKFRSMVDDAEEQVIDLVDGNHADGPLFKMVDDPRITRVGRALRRFSLDELPQLWNVLRGDMSLVGPRPAIPSEADGWSSNGFRRLNVPPGITGLWQISGRTDLTFDEYERLDAEYLENWSLWLDLKVFLKTIPAVLKGRGAY